MPGLGLGLEPGLKLGSELGSELGLGPEPEPQQISVISYWRTHCPNATLPFRSLDGLGGQPARLGVGLLLQACWCRAVIAGLFVQGFFVGLLVQGCWCRACCCSES